MGWVRPCTTYTRLLSEARLICCGCCCCCWDMDGCCCGCCDTDGCCCCQVVMLLGNSAPCGVKAWRAVRSALVSWYSTDIRGRGGGRGGDFNKEKCKWMEIASHDLCSTFVNCAGTADVLLYMWASFIAVSLSCYFLLLHAIMFPCCNSLTCVVGSWHREWGQETGRCHGNHWSSQRLGHLGGT